MKVFALDLWEDLREKRLWPVAALLAVALVAVPVLMLKPSASAPPSSEDAAQGGGAPRPDGSTVKAVANDSDLDVFDAKDPFRPRLKRKPGAGTATVVTPDAAKPAAPTSTAGSGSGGGGSGGSATSPAPKGTPTPVTPAPTPKTRTRTTRYTYVADVTFGRNGRLRRYRGVSRLAVLPSQRTPLLISLGIDGKVENAVFLVDASLKATGEGRCPPSGPACALLYLGAGSEEHFTQSDGDSFLLRVDAIRRVSLAKAAATSRKRARRAREAARRPPRRSFLAPVLTDLEIVASSAGAGSKPASGGR